MTLRIGTRKSALALVQAEEVRTRLLAAWPDLAEQGVKIVGMTTSGDRFLNQPLSEIGGKGLFTKEIEEALLASTIDIAVHSMKDMPTVLPDGLTIGCLLPREDARDMLVGYHIHALEDIPHGAQFGTSSLRRTAQMLALRPDIQVVPLRGNVQTRLSKLERGDMQATMLAVAGLNRLKLSHVPGVVLPVEQFLPAVAQGAIGIECRIGDKKTAELLAPLHDAATEAAITCERAFLRALDGSCRTPIAGYAQTLGDELHFRGLIAKPDGSDVARSEICGVLKDAEQLGLEAGMRLLKNTF